MSDRISEGTPPVWDEREQGKGDSAAQPEEGELVQLTKLLKNRIINLVEDRGDFNIDNSSIDVTLEGTTFVVNIVRDLEPAFYYEGVKQLKQNTSLFGENTKYNLSLNFNSAKSLEVEEYREDFLNRLELYSTTLLCIIDDNQDKIRVVQAQELLEEIEASEVGIDTFLSNITLLQGDGNAFGEYEVYSEFDKVGEVIESILRSELKIKKDKLKELQKKSNEHENQELENTTQSLEQKITLIREILGRDEEEEKSAKDKIELFNENHDEIFESVEAPLGNVVDLSTFTNTIDD